MGLHAVDAWLLRPVGEPDLPLRLLRLLRLGILMLLAGVSTILWSRLRSPRGREGSCWSRAR